MIRKENWQPQHRTESHPGLLSTQEKITEGWESVTQSSLNATRPYETTSKPTTGARARLLEKFLWQELTEQAYQEFIAPSPVEDYVTEYEGEFNVTDFQPSTEKIQKDSELHLKHPLYSDPPLSYWHQNKDTILGLSKVINPSHPFRRNSQFSKPLSDILDESVTGPI